MWAMNCPLITLKRVVFPAPFGPMTTKRSPVPTLKETRLSAWTPPKSLDRPSTLNASMSITDLFPKSRKIDDNSSPSIHDGNHKGSTQDERPALGSNEA